MSKPSNLYAEKIFSEQPLALWALDDTVDFVSLIDKQNRKLSSWTITGGTASDDATIVRQIKTSPVSKINTVSSSLVVCKSENLFNFQDLDEEKNNFDISLYFYSATAFIQSVKIGYEYTIAGITTTDLETYNVSVSNAWVFLSKKSNLPPGVVADVKLIIEIQTSAPGNYEFYINGLSSAQWSEKFNLVSDGTDMIDLPSEIPILGVLAHPAASYGLSTDIGYYLGSEKYLAAYNDGFPLVYGASGVTKIIPNGENPSLILPGKGFLNDNAKYQDLTLEFWIRIFSKSLVPRRIVGPISSQDGIYIDGSFLVLKVGSTTGSHFVGEWERPMLIDFNISPTTATLMLNGETVISIDINISNINLPKFKNAGKIQDWIGFYSYEDVPNLDVDCVAIYSYKVPEVVAKRRFVYGQGVDTPSNITGSLPGTTVAIDYRVSEYANNYIYPDMGSWNQAIVENLSTSNGMLLTPTYDLPTVSFKNSTTSNEEWISSCGVASSSQEFSSVDLSIAEVSGSQGYLYFQKLNLLSQDTKALYGVFSTSSNSKQILFKIENATNGSYLDVTIENGVVKYLFNYPGQQILEIVSEKTFQTNSMFAIGLDISKMSATYGGVVSRFFGASRKLSVFVGGQKTFTNTLNGNIYRFSFLNSRSSSKLADLFSTSGILDIVASQNESLEKAVNTVSSYTLNPRSYLGTFSLQVSTESYWQDYVPLTYFAKNLTNFVGETTQTLDYLQINLDVPKLDLFDGEFFDTGDLPVRSYVSFQYISLGANKTDISFTNVEPAPASGVIIPGENWLSTMYEITNDTIIYTPSQETFRNLAIVIHLQIKTAATTDIVKIKKLEIASQAIGTDKSLKINTKLGTPVLAYEQLGIYPNYKGINPLTIYKGSSPYIYLSKTSGINMKGDFPSNKFRGAFIPINQQRVDNYDIGAIQMFVNYPREYFSTIPIPIIEVKAYDRTSIVYVVADNPSGTRGRIYAIDKRTRLKDSLLNFFLNGKLVTSPYILPNEWNVLSFQFIKGLSFSEYSGHIGFIGPILFNNISTYRLSEIQSSISSIFRTWAQLPQMLDKAGNEDTYWGDFLSSDPVTTWENILFIPTIKTYLIDPSAIFDSFIGTNKYIVSDRSTLSLNNYKYRMYSDITWRSSIVSPV